MGLFSFVKDAGQRVASAVGLGSAAASPAPAAAAPEVAPAVDPAWLKKNIEAGIAGLNLGLAVEVAVEGSKVTLTGSAPTQKARELAVLVTGNLQGVDAVDDQLQVVAPEPPCIHHTVQKGDTLSKIARDVYGVMRMYDVIFEANQPMIRDADEIYPGQVLRVPPAAPPQHTVAKGETLGVIAKHWYGDAARYKDIFEANRGTLAHPDRVEVGQALVIPLIAPKITLA